MTAGRTAIALAVLALVAFAVVPVELHHKRMGHFNTPALIRGTTRPYRIQKMAIFDPYPFGKNGIRMKSVSVWPWDPRIRPPKCHMRPPRVGCGWRAAGRERVGSGGGGAEEV